MASAMMSQLSEREAALHAMRWAGACGLSAATQEVSPHVEELYNGRFYEERSHPAAAAVAESVLTAAPVAAS